MVKQPLMVRWVVRSIFHCETTELFLVPAILSVGWIIYKRTLAANQRVAHVVAAAGFLSLSEWSFTVLFLMPYNSKIKCVECVIK